MAVALEQRIEDVEELLLGAQLVGEELDVVDASSRSWLEKKWLTLIGDHLHEGRHCMMIDALMMLTEGCAR